MSKNKEFYYFVSYSCNRGFGRAFVRSVDDLSISKIEEFIMDQKKLSDLVVLFYKEISYDEFKKQTDYE
mgnify:CR=1